MSQTLISQVGLSAAARAGLYGPQISITKVKIGKDLITPTTAMTDVSGVVWEGDTSFIKYQVLNESSVLFKITLDENVGDFDVGNIGLFLESGELFAIVALPSVSKKIKNNLPDVVGNRRIYNIPIVLSGIANIVNLSILVADEASIPVVANETLLPDPLIAPYSAYSVLMHSKFGTPVIALRVDSNWWFIPAQLSEGSGYQFAASSFDTVDPPLVGECIRLDPESGLFKKADSTNLTNGYIGFRGTNNTVITSGRYTDPNSTEESPSFILGVKYYADGGLQSGKLTITPTAWYVGIACSPHSLLLDEQNISLATTSYPGNIQIATIEEVQSGQANNKAVTPYTIARGLTTAKPNELSNGQFYNVTTSSIPSWTLLQQGTSTYLMAIVPHQRQDWVEGPDNYLRFNTSVADTGSTESNCIYQRIPNASKYQNLTKTISFRSRSSVAGQRVIVKAKINFGTGGVPSPELNLITSAVIVNNQWNEFSVTFEIPQLTSIYTFGTDNNDYIEYSIGVLANETGNFDLDWVKLEVGSYATGINASTPEFCLQNTDQYIYGHWVFTNATLDGIDLIDSNLSGTTNIIDVLNIGATTSFTGDVTFSGNVKVTGTLTCTNVIEGTARKAIYG